MDSCLVYWERNGYQFALDDEQFKRREARKKSNCCSGFRSCIAQAANLVSVVATFAYIGAQGNYATSVQNKVSVVVLQTVLTRLAELSLYQHDLLALPFELLHFSNLGDNSATKRKCMRLTDVLVPHVDVFVACCGEPVDIIMDTVNAVAMQNYPKDRYHVFILDDGHSNELQKQIDTFKQGDKRKGRAEITYLRRNDRPTHYKAGNLNNGLRESAKCDKKGEFIASLDADMIVRPDWLRRILPHLLSDEKVALACPPQYFYNFPSEDLLCQSDIDPDENVPELIRDGLGTARCSGSAWVARRCAVDEIGGFPVNALTEDLMLTARLHGAGWKTVYVSQAMQCGLVAGSFHAYTKQVMRWTTGDIQVARALHWFLPGLQDTAKMSITQRISYILSSIARLHSFATCAALIVLPIAVLPGQAYVVTYLASHRSLEWMRWTRLTKYLATKASDYFLFGHVGMSSVTKARTNRIWMAPYTMVAVIKAYVPNVTAFQSTGSVTSSTNERSATGRRPIAYRITHPHIMCYAIYALYTGVAALIFLVRLVAMIRNTPDSSLVPFTGIAIKLMECIQMCWTPVRYMLYPPSSPDRRELLERDESGVNRPKGELCLVRKVPLMWIDVLEFLFIYGFDWWQYSSPTMHTLLLGGFILCLFNANPAVWESGEKEVVTDAEVYYDCKDSREFEVYWDCGESWDVKKNGQIRQDQEVKANGQVDRREEAKVNWIIKMPNEVEEGGVLKENGLVKGNGIVMGNGLVKNSGRVKENGHVDKPVEVKDSGAVMIFGAVKERGNGQFQKNGHKRG